MASAPDMKAIAAGAGRALQADQPLRPSDVLAIFALILGVIAGLAYATLKPRHLVGETIGVLSLDGGPRTAIAAIAMAGGAVLRDGGFGGAVVARAPDAGFVDRLYAAGADVVYRIDRNVNCVAAVPLASNRNQVPVSLKTPQPPRAGWTMSGDG
jgi:hypothetical protein